jgi:hypothetical protein
MDHNHHSSPSSSFTTYTTTTAATELEHLDDLIISGEQSTVCSHDSMTNSSPGLSNAANGWEDLLDKPTPNAEEVVETMDDCNNNKNDAADEMDITT